MPGTRRSAASSVASGGLALGLVLWLSFGSPGYFADRYTTAAGIALVGLAAILAVLPPAYRLSGASVLALVGLTSLTLWTGLSGTWSPLPAVARMDVERDVLYVGLLGLGILAAGSGRRSPWLLGGVAGAMAVVVLLALASRLAPGLVPSDPPFGAAYRLAYPLGYWNALGAVAAMLVVLATGLAAEERLPVAVRAGCAVLVVPGAVTLELTLSRGSVLALAAGLLALLALGPARARVLLVLLPLAAASAFAVWRLQGYDALVTDPALGSGQRHEGGRFAILLAATSIVAALAVVLVARVRVPPGLRLPRPTRATAVRAAIAPTVAGLTVLAVLIVGADVNGGAAHVSTQARDWISGQWHQFTTVDESPDTGTSRLGSVQSARSDLYRVAIAAWRDSPLRGHGSGAFEVDFARDRRVTQNAQDAHSLELETLAELGLVGFAVLIVFLGGLGWGLVRSRRTAMPLSRGESGAVGAALTAWVVHGAIDWDWQVPALTGFALLLAASALPLGTERRRRRHDPAPSPPEPRPSPPETERVRVRVRT